MTDTAPQGPPPDPDPIPDPDAENLIPVTHVPDDEEATDGDG